MQHQSNSRQWKNQTEIVFRKRFRKVVCNVGRVSGSYVNLAAPMDSIELKLTTLIIRHEAGRINRDREFCPYL
ncbi:hypothetical protein S1OALGB6SA_2311 [Olavius algarvensis spirochete endosymbiont]|uniref:hypothetical protein n=1 Tax=Olavius algarvensis spirochete endosymbiont TaxID=260710 RepID=UPI000F2D4549|nr:hypothetical protein [Olavius algarvensis spirochete endosymbiont]CAD7845454.1 MAG: hypothetical protein [Olavius algarvensis spirochete endosymbiont]VDB01210.1 hypothetical protein S1OALGB6SA_2311 [Olavius algarvensis spirochete endosymbiont]